MRISTVHSAEVSQRIPSLDGLRAISIALVLLLHMSGSKNFVPYKAIEPFNPGGLGVRMFFVISAFLITTLLLKELAKAGTISLRNFYRRRARRILPAFGAYLLVIVILASTGVIRLQQWDLIRAVTFTMNYGDHSWWVGHVWSLSVEEQFYLLWPAALCYLGRARGMTLAVGAMIAIPPIRLAVWMLLPSWRASIGYTFETCADAFAAGCLLAGMREWLGGQQNYLRFQKSPLFVLVPVGILLGSMSFVSPRIGALVGIPIENICIALVVDRAVRIPSDSVGRILNSRVLVYVGTLTYSIYLWQQLFCRRVEVQNWSTAFPANLLLLSACALACFYLIEKPALRCKGGLAVSKEQGGERKRKLSTSLPLFRPALLFLQHFFNGRGVSRIATAERGTE